MKCLILLLFVSLSQAMIPRVEDQNLCFVENTVFNRGELVASKRVHDEEECQVKCQLSGGCSHFSFNTRNHHCYLRQGDTPQYQSGVISGPKWCQGSYSMKYFWVLNEIFLNIQ